MPDGSEILAPVERLYQASRFWKEAGDEWTAAATRLPDGKLSGWALGSTFYPTGDDFARVYNECVDQIRDTLLAGAEALHHTAAALQRSAAEYVTVDGELTARIDRLVDQVG